MGRSILLHVPTREIEMDFNFTLQQEKFREELREFLTAEVPVEKQEIFGLLTEEQYQFGREINLKLAERK